MTRAQLFDTVRDIASAIAWSIVSVAVAAGITALTVVTILEWVRP